MPPGLGEFGLSKVQVPYPRRHLQGERSRAPDRNCWNHRAYRDRLRGCGAAEGRDGRPRPGGRGGRHFGAQKTPSWPERRPVRSRHGRVGRPGRVMPRRPGSRPGRRRPGNAERLWRPGTPDGWDLAAALQPGQRPPARQGPRSASAPGLRGDRGERGDARFRLHICLFPFQTPPRRGPHLQKGAMGCTPRSRFDAASGAAVAARPATGQGAPRGRDEDLLGRGTAGCA